MDVTGLINKLINFIDTNNQEARNTFTFDERVFIASSVEIRNKMVEHYGNDIKKKTAHLLDIFFTIDDLENVINSDNIPNHVILSILNKIKNTSKYDDILLRKIASISEERWQEQSLYADGIFLDTNRIKALEYVKNTFGRSLVIDKFKNDKYKVNYLSEFDNNLMTNIIASIRDVELKLQLITKVSENGRHRIINSIKDINIKLKAIQTYVTDESLITKFLSMLDENNKDIINDEIIAYYATKYKMNYEHFKKLVDLYGSNAFNNIGFENYINAINLDDESFNILINTILTKENLQISKK